ncbi:MAG: SDR family oxidoreductase [Verrucomicrobia bacterium]|nr:SDR family oxidoreductase [Verrucomicrobiota bacterium]
MMSNSIFDLTGKIALVTGGAGHLGSAFSEILAANGATVVIASPNLEKSQAFALKLGPKHEAMKLDLDDSAAIGATMDQIVKCHGALDVLVNNGYSGPAPSIDKATPEDFDKTLHRGLTSYFVASQQASFHMRKRGSGSIINIASMYGLVASYPEVYVGSTVNSPPNYHALKGGLIHLTRHLAVYWACHGIRVNAISPGPFPPKRVLESPGGREFIERLSQKVPLKRMGEPREVQGALLLLASEAGSFITGQNIVVDGGWTAW